MIDAHEIADVFDADDECQQPHEQRQDTEDVFERRLDIGRGEAGLDGIQRARPDIAEDHAERSDGKRRIQTPDTSRAVSSRNARIRLRHAHGL
jgi:hypothetical protein